jgi:hypothetical protein
VVFGGSSGARVALVSLVLWELYGAEKVPHLFGLAGRRGWEEESLIFSWLAVRSLGYPWVSIFPD